MVCVYRTHVTSHGDFGYIRTQRTTNQAHFERRVLINPRRYMFVRNSYADQYIVTDNIPQLGVYSRSAQGVPCMIGQNVFQRWVKEIGPT